MVAAHGGRRTLPWAFTEHGALMAATVLRSEQAVRMSVYVVRAFIRQREQLAANAAILRRLAEIDATLLVHDAALRKILDQLRPLLTPPPAPPRRRIGFHPRRAGPGECRPDVLSNPGNSRMSVNTTVSAPSSHAAGVSPPA